jgi:NADH-quinone oxidoreductase subunit E
VTDDGLFSIQKVECLGSCHTAPVIQVNDEPYVECVTKARLHALLDGLRQGKKVEDIQLPGKVGHVVHNRGDEVSA